LKCASIALLFALQNRYEPSKMVESHSCCAYDNNPEEDPPESPTHEEQSQTAQNNHQKKAHANKTI